MRITRMKRVLTPFLLALNISLTACKKDTSHSIEVYTVREKKQSTENPDSLKETYTVRERNKTVTVERQPSTSRLETVAIIDREYGRTNIYQKNYNARPGEKEFIVRDNSSTDFQLEPIDETAHMHGDVYVFEVLLTKEGNPAYGIKLEKFGPEGIRTTRIWQAENRSAPHARAPALDLVTNQEVYTTTVFNEEYFTPLIEKEKRRNEEIFYRYFIPKSNGFIDQRDGSRILLGPIYQGKKIPGKLYDLRDENYVQNGPSTGGTTETVLENPPKKK